MQSYNYSLTAAEAAKLRTIPGLEGDVLARDRDTEDPAVGAVVGPVTPGGLANKLFDLANTKLNLSASQEDGAISIDAFEMPSNPTVVFTVEVPIPFGTA